MQNRNNYAPEWFDTIRPAILKRDNYKCQKCFVKHRSKGYYDSHGNFVECDQFMLDWAKRNQLKPITIYLHVAHLDQNPANNSESNLKSLCPRCHLNFDRPFNLIKRKQR